MVPRPLQGMLDEEILMLAKQGQTHAAECLISRYRPWVESCARHYFIAGSEREDVLQEGMVGLCKAMRDYEDHEHHRFRPFAELCVTRQIISAVKSATRRKHSLLNDSVALTTPILESTESTLEDCIADPYHLNPEEAILGREFPKEVQRMLKNALTPIERNVLLGTLNGMSYQQMSETFHCRAKSIDNALQRVKRKVSQARS